MDNGKPAAALYGLAILKANWDRQNKTYLDSFLPFVVECLRVAGRSLDFGQLQAAVSQDFGLRIPQTVLKSIVTRGTRTKVLTLQHGVVSYVGTDKTNDFARIRGTAEREQNALVGRFVAFARDKHSQQIDERQAEALLVAFAEVISIPFLKNLVSGVGLGLDGEMTKKESFLVASFVDSLCQSDPEGFTYLETLVKGSMLSGYLYVADPGTVQMAFKSTALVLDSAVLLDVLGLHGQEEKVCAKEWLELARDLGADLVCLRETAAEVDGILEGCQRALKDSTSTVTTAVYRYCRKAKYSSSDVQLLRSKLEQLLTAEHVRVDKSVRHMSDRASQGLADLLQSEVHYSRSQTREHDLRAVMSVARLREGRNDLRLERCGAVFVTNNEALVRAATKFLPPAQLGETPLAMTATDLGTIIWLKRPVAAPDLPRRRLFADCYAALQPDEGLWRAFIEEADNLETKGTFSTEDYYLLRCSQYTDRVLMEETLGEPKAVTSETVKEVLEGVLAAIREELKGQLAEQIARPSGQQVLPLDTAEPMVSSRTPDVHPELPSAYELAHKARLKNISLRVASAVVWSVRVLVGALLLAAIVLSVPLATPIISSLGRDGGIAVSVAMFVVFVLYCILAFANLMGFSIKSWFQSLHRILADRVFGWLCAVSVPAERFAQSSMSADCKANTSERGGS